MEPKGLVEEGRYSFGSTPFVDTIIKLLEEPKNKHDTVAINVSTILRNTDDLADNPKAWVAAALNELFSIVGEINNVMEVNNIKMPFIALYYMDYSGLIPVNLVRTKTVKRQLFDNTLKKFLTELNNQRISSQPATGETLAYRCATSKQTNPDTLVSFIKRVQNTRNVLLVSHIPLDFHIARSLRNVLLVSSHTGSVVDKKGFNKKVFKTTDIPFTIDTHAILGDTVSFKSILKPKLKKELMQASVRENWAMQSNAQVRTSMNNAGFFPAFKICR